MRPAHATTSYGGNGTLAWPLSQGLLGVRRGVAGPGRRLGYGYLNRNEPSAEPPG
jgi:hypothetical protein